MTARSLTELNIEVPVKEIQTMAVIGSMQSNQLLQNEVGIRGSGTKLDFNLDLNVIFLLVNFIRDSRTRKISGVLDPRQLCSRKKVAAG
jgi:hypothetical protein